MKKAIFSIKINAPKLKVWEALWKDRNYREWTSAFTEGSYAVSDWEEGSKILFLAPDGGGMYSEIEKLVPNEYMSFKHLGEVKDGKELPADETTSSWYGAHENYRLTETGGVTEVQVEVEIEEKSDQYFQEAFPKALAKLKAIAER